MCVFAFIKCNKNVASEKNTKVTSTLTEQIFFFSVFSMRNIEFNLFSPMCCLNLHLHRVINVCVCVSSSFRERCLFSFAFCLLTIFTYHHSYLININQKSTLIDDHTYEIERLRILGYFHHHKFCVRTYSNRSHHPTPSD